MPNATSAAIAGLTKTAISVIVGPTIATTSVAIVDPTTPATSAITSIRVGEEIENITQDASEAVAICHYLLNNTSETKNDN